MLRTGNLEQHKFIVSILIKMNTILKLYAPASDKVLLSQLLQYDLFLCDTEINPVKVSKIHHHHSAISFCLYYTNHTEFPIDQLTAQIFIWCFIFHFYYSLYPTYLQFFSFSKNRNKSNKSKWQRRIVENMLSLFLSFS